MTISVDPVPRLTLCRCTDPTSPAHHVLQSRTSNQRVILLSLLYYCHIASSCGCRPSKQLAIDSKDYNTKFALRGTRRSDSGEYTITAENSSGKDQVTVKVTITDKPAKPEGPLEVRAEGRLAGITGPARWRVRDRNRNLVFIVVQDDHLLFSIGVTYLFTYLFKHVMLLKFVVQWQIISFFNVILRSKAYKPVLKRTLLMKERAWILMNGAPKCDVFVHQISDVHKNGCKIKWNPPKDDGGTPIDHFEVEKFDPETGIWMPAGRSDKPEIEVNNLTPGHEYKFRVKAVNAEGASEPLEGTESIIAKNPFGESCRFSVTRVVVSLLHELRVIL